MTVCTQVWTLNWSNRVWKVVLLAGYVVFIVAGFALAIMWSKRKRRENAQSFLTRPLKKDFYVSVEFCIGFALASLAAVAVFKFLGVTV